LEVIIVNLNKKEILEQHLLTALPSLSLEVIKITPLEKDENKYSYNYDIIEPETIGFFVWFVKNFYPDGFNFQIIINRDNKQIKEACRVTRLSKRIIDNYPLL
jgi:hypothetical protein